MHSLVLIATILGAGALAFPQNKHAHLHEKKDVVFYSQWQDGPHTLIEEYINDNVAAGNGPAPAQTSAAVQVKANYAYPQGGSHNWAGKQVEHAAAPTTTAAAAPVITPQPTSSTPPIRVVEPSSTSSPASVPESSGSDDTSTTGNDTTTNTTGGSCNPTDGDAWYSPPCTGSSGASALDKINHLRTTWNSSLSNYAWDPALAQNAHDTAWLATTWTTSVDPNTGKTVYTPDGEGRGWVMGHHLFNGTNGQCIAEGDNTSSKGSLTPIETMFLMWICEKPSAGIQDLCTQTGNTDGDSKCECEVNESCACGHAMIIQNGEMNSIGCYFMNKVAEGKTDNAVNDEEKAQELGTEGNSAPGMLTCDFTA